MDYFLSVRAGKHCFEQIVTRYVLTVHRRVAAFCNMVLPFNNISLSAKFIVEIGIKHRKSFLIKLVWKRAPEVKLPGG